MRPDPNRPSLAGPELYDEEYFLRHCGGHEMFRQSRGRRLDDRLSIIFQLAGLRPGMRVLDVGCGRGELVRQGARLGAWVWGLDFSPQALGIARGTIHKTQEGVRGKSGLLRGRADFLPVADGSVDRVILSDIMEHLAPPELRRLVRESHRVLNNGGSLTFHTFPNRWFYSLYYPIRRIIRDLPAGRAGPRNPRTAHERKMHVNELSPLEIRKLFRPLFSLRMWCAHRSRWDPAGRRFLLPMPSIPWLCEPEIWGIAEKRPV